MQVTTILADSVRSLWWDSLTINVELLYKSKRYVAQKGIYLTRFSFR